MGDEEPTAGPDGRSENRHVLRVGQPARAFPILGRGSIIRKRTKQPRGPASEAPTPRSDPRRQRVTELTRRATVPRGRRGWRPPPPARPARSAGPRAPESPPPSAPPALRTSPTRARPAP